MSLFDIYKAKQLGAGTGSLFDAKAGKSLGGSSPSFNIWDEEWELGAVLNSNGQNADSYTDRIRSKNYIPIVPGTLYYVYSGTQAVMYKRFYDADKNYLGSSYSLDTSMNGGFNAPVNAYYMRFNLQPSYGTAYKSDICINVSDPSKDGRYEPYHKEEE